TAERAKSRRPRSRSAPASACRCCSGNEGEDEDSQEDALRAVDGDADPGALVSLRWVGDGEGVDGQRPRDRPREVEVVGSEEDSVREPVLALEDAVHARQEEAAEEQLLTEHGVEDEPDEDERVPAPGAVQERLARVRAEERAEVSALRPSQRDQRLDEGCDHQRDHDEPDPAAGAARARAPRRAEPERLADGRPAEGPLLAPDKGGHEHELPDEPDREADVQRLEERDVAGSGELVLQSGRDEPARAAIGSAAAAHTAKIARSPYCGIATSETAASV